MNITFESVRDIITETLSCGGEEITLDTRLVEDLEADSLELVELAMALQEELGITIEDEDMAKLKTVRDVLEYSQSKQG